MWWKILEGTKICAKIKILEGTKCVPTKYKFRRSKNRETAISDEVPI
jgi:hypothetical protein